jgi:hypothetical protein
MDRIEHSPRTSEIGGLRPCAVPASNTAPADTAPRLALVSAKLVLAAPVEAPRDEWTGAIERLVDAMEIDLEWTATDRQASLMDKARQVIGTAARPGAPVFAPWQCWSPTDFQGGIARRQMPRVQWVASYLFDSGSGRPAASASVDLALISPLPVACEAEDAGGAAMPRLGVLRAMLGAAASEGRERLAIVVPEANRNAMSALLVAARPDCEVEVLAIEDAVVRIQSGAADWDAVIAMPELRGILFAMLSQSSGVSAPWPMLWHDRGLAMVASEGLGGRADLPLDATLLLQALALAARHGGSGALAERLHQGWAALRDRGVVTPSRGSPAPYVNEVSEADFLDLAGSAPSSDGRALPEWKGVASGRTAAIRRPGPARLALVASS